MCKIEVDNIVHLKLFLSTFRASAKMPDQLLDISEAAKKLGVSIKTLRRWEKQGILASQRTAGNHRRYTKQDVERLYEKLQKARARKSPELADTSEELLDINQASRKLGVSTKTLRRWESRGLLAPQRTGGNHRRYSFEDLKRISKVYKKEQSIPSISFAPAQIEVPILPPTITFEQVLEKDDELRSNILPKKSSIPRAILISSATVFSTFAAIVLIVFMSQLILAGDSDNGGLVAKGVNLFSQKASETGKVLAASTSDIFSFKFNVPVNIGNNLKVEGTVDIDGLTTTNGGITTNNSDIDAGTGTLTASNVIYSLTAGDGISITPGQTPTIANTGVLSLQGATGAVTLTAGSGISITGTTITNTASSGGGGGGGSFNTFASIIAGSTTIQAAGANDELTFIAGNGLSITADSTLKTLTFDPDGETVAVASCVTTENGIVTGSGTCQAGTEQWVVANGTIYPDNPTLDLLIGGQATTSAKFALLNMSNGTPTASLSANSGANSLFITGDGNLATTNSQTLTLGGATTGNIVIDSGSSSISLSDSTTVSGFVNLTSGNSYQINGNSVLDATTLGSAVVNSSLTSVGALISGSIANGFGTIATTNTITGTTLNGTLGINTGAGAGTQRIDVSGNLVNINNLTAGGTITFSAFTQAGGVLFTNNSGVVAQTGTGTSQQCLVGGAVPFFSSCGTGESSDAFFNQGNGLLFTNNSTVDFAIGGQSSDSAKFAVLNVNTGTPTASVSAGTATSGGAYLTATGNLATTNFQTLTLGGSTTGNITLNPQNGAGTTTANGTFTTTGPTNLGDGGDVINLNGSQLNIASFLSAGGVLFTNGSGTVAQTSSGLGTQCLIGGPTPSWGSCSTGESSDTLWNQQAGLLFPNNSTVDFAIGGQATTSAKFAVLNVNTGTPVASLSATTSGLSFSSLGTIQSLRSGTLTIGGSTTGHVEIDPGSGRNLIENLTGTGIVDINLASYVNNIGGVDIVRTGNFTGVAGEEAHDLRVSPSLTVTDPGSSFFEYTAGLFDTSNIAVAAGAGDTYIASLKLDVGSDTDAASYIGLYIADTTATAADQYGIFIDANYDKDLAFAGDTSVVFNFQTAGTTLSFVDEAINTLCTITDNSNVGDLNCTGNFTMGGSTITASSLATFTTSATLSLTATTLNLGGGAAATIGTVSGDNLSLSPNGTGDIRLVNDSDTDIIAPFFTSNGGILYTNGSGVFAQATAGTTTQCLLGGTTPTFGNCNQSSIDAFWSQSNGLLYPNNSTVDFAIGGQATTSAKFAVLNVNSGTPTATIAGNLLLMPFTSGANQLGGRLGVGTISPDALLHVQTTASTSAILSTVNNSSNTSLQFLEGGGSGSGVKLFYDGTNNELRFQDVQQGGGIPDIMTLERTSLAVGIGTNAPSTSLGDTSAGRILAVEGTSAYGLLRLSNSATGISEMGRVSFGSPGFSGSEKRTAAILSINTTASTTDPTGNLEFYTTNAGTIAQQMIIEADGNVGIGVADALAPLHLDGGSITTGNILQTPTTDNIIGWSSVNGLKWDSSTGPILNSSANLLLNIDADNDTTGEYFNISTGRSTSSGGTSLFTIFENGTLQSTATLPNPATTRTNFFNTDLSGTATGPVLGIDNWVNTTTSFSSGGQAIYNMEVANRIGASGGGGSPGTITNSTGILLSDSESNGTTITTSYGIYISALAGTTRYGIYDQSGAMQYFAGNVGIGTTGPTSLLEVSGGNASVYQAIGAGDNLRTGLRSYDSTAIAADIGGALVLGYKYTGSTYTEGAIVKMYKLNATDGDYSSGIKFQVRDTGENLATQMTLNPSGNLGIGLSTVPAKFSLANNVGSGFDAYSDYQILLYDAGTAASSYGLGIESSTLMYQAGTSGIHNWYIANSSKMILNSTGLGIGGSPSDKLEAYGANGTSIYSTAIQSGTANWSGFISRSWSGAAQQLWQILGGSLTGGASEFAIYEDGNLRMHIDTSNNVLFPTIANGNGTNPLCFNTTGGALTYATTACTASSQRFKHDITTLSSQESLDELMQLRPVSFVYNANFKPEDQTTHVGFVAEEIMAIDPRLVTWENDGITPHGVQYENITALLTGAVQVLNNNLINVGNRVSDLEGIVDGQEYFITDPNPSNDPFYADYQVKNSSDGTVVDKIGAFAKIVSANIETGLLYGKAVKADNLDVGKSNFQDLTSNIATVSGSLFADTVVAGNIKIANSNIDLTTLSTKVDFIENLLAELNISSNSGELTTVDNLMVSGSTTLSDAVILNNLTIGNNLTINNNSIETLGTPLEIQPLAQGDINFLGGKITFALDGKVKFEEDAEFAKDVSVGGVLSAKDIESTGSATFGKLNIDGTAGSGILSAGETELIISNSKVSADSLIYITPVGGTNNQVLYVKDQIAGESFTVGVDNTLSSDIKFNWIIVN